MKYLYNIIWHHIIYSMSIFLLFLENNWNIKLEMSFQANKIRYFGNSSMVIGQKSAKIISAQLRSRLDFLNLIFYFGERICLTSGDVPSSGVRQTEGRTYGMTSRWVNLAEVRQWLTRSVPRRFDFKGCTFISINRLTIVVSHMTFATNYKYRNSRGAWLVTAAGLRLTVWRSGGLRRAVAWLMEKTTTS